MFEVGATLRDRYQLVALVARGGMGEVWSAQDTVLGRRVAVKVLLPNLAGNPGFAARFLAEARAMAALSHPGIVEIYDYGQADGLAFLVMQFVEGESLVSLIRRTGPVTPQRAMQLVVQAADAIEAAHRQGIVHRDVKPANLLLRADGRLALSDFGIARILATDRLTVGEQIVGTSSYLAPEQVTGHEIGPATDVYALGVVAYELLTGSRPFEADTPFGVALKHVHEDPPPLPETIAEPVREVVLRAMAKDPAARWPSAAALAHAAATAIGMTLPTGPMPTAVVGAVTAPWASLHLVEGAAPVPQLEVLTGPTTRAPAPAWEKPTAAAVPARKRLLLLGGGALTLAIAATLIFVLSWRGTSEPQSQRPDASLSPTATAASVSPAASVAPSASGTRAATSTATTPAGTTPTGPTAKQSTPAATAKVPILYGWKESEVTSEMTRLGLVARITYRWTPDKCYAIEQSPPGGTVLSTGSTVEVVIAKATGICQEV
ncbi:hypothetical protein Rhe02_57970 [Rhizocola hellebori]|uniref:non-specific serine/threonine protein kinase n=1 Tax=Rhizocola hellebori TaxID=1392758 RepID=A0A8J3QDP9_9ACTN|nr:serine/threonine-protein kinase [Rhizocola hellebori]GIH07730.1 hypothetical protein Rhe02_57970 [Rhizocola hellebori]